MEFVRIHEIKIDAREAKGLSADELEALLLRRTGRRLRLPSGSLRKIRIAKESLDAREKPDVFRVFSVDVLDSEFEPQELLAEARRARAKAAVVTEETLAFPGRRELPEGTKRPVVAGFGPCGIFAALTLAEAGLNPIVLERGACMEERVASVEKFWREGALDPRTNVQFGEGGAGSFSDGKLTTGTKDPVHRLLLQTFADAGAPADILYKQHPHIGTDVLRAVVVSLRRKIGSLGGEVRFCTQLTGLTVEDGKLTAVEAQGPDGQKETIETDALILALGHSARDSFALLYEAGLRMEQKPFSMGVRIEHRQEDIDLAQYGAPHEELGIGAAEYKLSVRTKAGRGVYTFCMCPGGYVVNASSEEKRLAVNGMSYRARDSKNANSAIIVTVGKQDFGDNDALTGVRYQKKLEEAAFLSTDGSIPQQLYKDFSDGSGSSGYGGFVSCACGKTAFADLNGILPKDIAESIKEAIPVFDRTLPGFARDDAILSGVESRTSSPLRILRNEHKQCNIEGLYPCGEGAGYAGGIVSAAVDGLKVMEVIIRVINREE